MGNCQKTSGVGLGSLSLYVTWFKADVEQFLGLGPVKLDLNTPVMQAWRAGCEPFTLVGEPLALETPLAELFRSEVNKSSGTIVLLTGPPSFPNPFYYFPPST